MGGQVWIQLIGIGSVLVFTVLVTWGILKLVAAITGLRVGEEDEVEGLDIALHEERGYDIH